MQERLNWTVSKTVVAQATVGSNPTLSVLEIIGVCSVFYDSIGAVAQLGERIPRTDEVTGSTPVCSIYSKVFSGEMQEMAELACLESMCAVLQYRGFESHSLRQF